MPRILALPSCDRPPRRDRAPLWPTSLSSARRLCRPTAAWLVAALATGFVTGAACAAQAAAVGTAPIVLQVDATDVLHRVLQIVERVPLRRGGTLVLQFPAWIPGTHAPIGQIGRVAGLEVRSGERRLAWQRDALDVGRFAVEVPAEARELELRFQYLTPVGGGDRVVMTRSLLGLQWHQAVLYPAGIAARELRVQPALRLPAGWTHASALVDDGPAVDGMQRFATVSLETLVDSPVYAGAQVRRIDLDAAGAARPVRLTLLADEAPQLDATAAQWDAHRRLVEQADRLFGSRHYSHYEFLLALSETLGGIGLEHHMSSENVVEPDYFKDWDKRIGSRSLLPHEYVHSWNGKFRRPAGLATPDFTQPMRTDLLWVYEGQTQFWGEVLAVRSGLATPELWRERLARIAAWAQAQRGRRWRSLQDTTASPTIAAVSRGGPQWWDWQRGYDYYDEGLLLWLEADLRLRDATDGARSLDDFARAFFGVDDGATGPLTYGFDDVAAALDRIGGGPWAPWLRARLDALDNAPLGGIEASGWRLVFDDRPSPGVEADQAARHVADFSFSIGLRIGREGRIESVAWDGPAYRAGVRPEVTLVAVNRHAYKDERLKQAITANRDGASPVELLLRDGDEFRVVTVDVRGGLRYPHLVRIDGRPDRLAALLAPR
jgi:predicted metalloprotease with PDZ domain